MCGRVACAVATRALQSLGALIRTRLNNKVGRVLPHAHGHMSRATMSKLRTHQVLTTGIAYGSVGIDAQVVSARLQLAGRAHDGDRVQLTHAEVSVVVVLVVRRRAEAEVPEKMP